MNKIQFTKHLLQDSYWLRYCNEDGYVRNISLSACANSFRLVTKGAYDTEGDNLQCVGWRYEEDGCLCHELFCIGHLVVFTPLKPSLLERLGYMLRGKDAQKAHQEKMMEFEKALNRGGWKTIYRKL